MAHYAFLDSNNFVVEVITGRDENDLLEGITSWEIYYGNIRGLTCKRTSYNTYYDGETIFDGNGEAIGVTENNSKHRDGKNPFRGKFASIGDLYDEDNDVFINRPQQ